MERTVIAGIYFEAIGVTKDELNERMDRLGMDAINSIGGAPWVLVQDSSEKTQALTPIRDEQGMCYTGSRRYIFQGPLVAHPFQVHHDGFKPQGEEV